jgi:lauroyl/myristoyl acyltransferase
VRCFAGRPQFADRGLIVAGLHLSGFDLALQLICLKWLKPLVVTIPNPVGGRQMEFEIRKKTGMNLVPADLGGIRQAVRHLEKGGLIVTGMDRPGLEYPLRPRFFNQPAALPTHHIYLAVKTHTPIMIVVAHLDSDGKYHISASSPIEMDSYPDRHEEQLRNAEKVLSVAETYIRRAPTQWSITKPVWPEAMSQVPASAQVPGFFSTSRG